MLPYILRAGMRSSLPQYGLEEENKMFNVKRVLAILLAFALCVGYFPTVNVVRAEGNTVTETLDLDDTAVFDMVGSDFITEKTDDENGTYYEFVGGGTGVYNKITTKATYSGNIVLTYDIQFQSTESSEMILATPRGNYSDDTSKHFLSSITSNFVLHTSGSGLRLSYTSAKGANVSGRAASDSTMSDSYSDQMTDVWYTVKIVLYEDYYYAKFWPAGEEEPTAYNCTLAAAEGDLTEGIIGFAKRGTGKVLLRNVKVDTLKAEENPTYTAVAELSGITAEKGTAANTIGLPESVTVTLSDGTLKVVAVTWNTDNYQADTPGTYTLTGTLAADEGQNPDNLTASIQITVYDYAHTMTLPQDSAEWIHNEAGTFEAGTDGEDTVIVLGGGGTNAYNKIISTTAFSGDLRMEFEVKFSSDASSEMLKFTPRMDPISTDTGVYDGVCGNFVLHTATSGLRLSNNNSTVVTDTTISDNSLSPTDTWYSVKFEIVGNEYKVKFWPSDSTEPSDWSCTYTFTDVAESGSIAFMKRGSGTLMLKNISVSYNTVEPFQAASVGALAPVTVLYGTSFAGLELPASVDVVGANNALRHVNVTWDEASYDAATSGSQTVTGMLDLLDEENPNGLKASVDVYVTPEDAVFFTSSIIKSGDDANITTYHQFGTITTKAGTILATCEARVGGGDANNPMHIVLWRSTDGGRTWSDTIIVADATENPCSENENDCSKGIYGHCYANPTPVVDYETGKIFLFYSENFSNASSKLYYRTSTDDGVTWSDPTEVTSLFDEDPYARTFHLPGPGHGLQIESGEYEGRLIVEVWHRYTVSLASSERKYGLSVLYSDDGGATWENSDFIEIGYNMNEGRVAQLAGGVLVINSRSTDSTRKQTYSTDGGVTWSTPTTWTSIGNYGNCDSGFTSQVEGDSTQLITTHILTGTSVRNTLYAYLSYDNGVTWTAGTELWSVPSISSGTGASDANRISKDTYGVIHGTSWNNTDVEYVVFNTAYLTEVSDDSSLVPTYAAQIGVTNYDTLAEAVSAAKDGDNIVIRSDIAVAEAVQLNKKVTIDLNGNALWVEDLDELCAEGYSAEYDAATGLWKVTEDENTDTAVLTSYGKSLVFEDIVQIRYYFSYDASNSDHEYDLTTEAGILVWNSEQEAYTVENASYQVAGLTARTMEDGNTYYYATGNGIPAKNWGDTVYACGYLKNDETYILTEVTAYSPLTYATNMLAKDQDTRFDALLVAMLNYGTAAQNHFGYDTENPVNAGLTDAEKVWVWEDTLLVERETVPSYSFTPDEDNISFYGWSLLYEGAIGERMYSKISEELITGAQETGMLYWTAGSETVDGISVDTAKKIVGLKHYKDDLYYATIPGTAAKDLANTYFACAYVVDSSGETHYGPVRSYSAHTYAKNMISSDSQTEALKDLCKTMVIYGAAANDWFYRDAT